MVTEMMSDVVPDMLPIVVGALKSPSESLNSAVNTFPILKLVQPLTKVTLNVFPAQTLDDKDGISILLLPELYSHKSARF